MRRLAIALIALLSLAPPSLAQSDITHGNKRSTSGNTVYYDAPPPHLPGYRLIRDGAGNYYWHLRDGDWTHWAAQTSSTGRAPTRTMGPAAGALAYNGGINLAAMMEGPSKAGFTRGGGTGRPLVLRAQHDHAPGDCPDDTCPNVDPAPKRPKVEPAEPDSSDPIEQFLLRRGMDPKLVLYGIAALVVVLLVGFGLVGLLLLVLVIRSFRSRP